MTGSAAVGGVLDRFRLDGKVVVVTGANRGLGRALVTAFAEAGADVGLAVRDVDGVADQREELAGLGRRSAVARCDVADARCIEDSVAAIEDALGPIDVWVNNAGITHWGDSLAEDAGDAWQRVMDTNAGGVFHCTRAVGRRMAARGRGSVVNIGSISGLIVNRPQSQAAYNASKAAIHHVTKSLAVELAPSGVRVNALAPGYIRTDMVAAQFEDPAFREDWIERVPMQRPAEPVEVASAAVFLAGEGASFMTGSVVVVDGGYVLT